MIKSNQFAKQWTDGAIFCYNRGCNCDGCFVKDLIESQKCEMKSAVISLVKKLGIPRWNTSEKYTKGQMEVISAILNGITTKEELAKVLKITVTNVQSKLNALYNIARYDGCIFYNQRNMLPDYVKWIRKECQNESYD